MILGLGIVSFFLFLSLAANVALYLKAKQAKARPQSVELREFLADITGGVGFLAITRLAPEDFVLRSPRSGG